MDRVRSRQPANRNCQGCRASHELCSNYLFFSVQSSVLIKSFAFCCCYLECLDFILFSHFVLQVLVVPIKFISLFQYFCNLFGAAEPHEGMAISHGTPRSESYRLSGDRSPKWSQKGREPVGI